MVIMSTFQIINGVFSFIEYYCKAFFCFIFPLYYLDSRYYPHLTKLLLKPLHISNLLLKTLGSLKYIHSSSILTIFLYIIIVQSLLATLSIVSICLLFHKISVCFDLTIVYNIFVHPYCVLNHSFTIVTLFLKNVFSWENY